MLLHLYSPKSMCILSFMQTFIRALPPHFSEHAFCFHSGFYHIGQHCTIRRFSIKNSGMGRKQWELNTEWSLHNRKPGLHFWNPGKKVLFFSPVYLTRGRDISSAAFLFAIDYSASAALSATLSAACSAAMMPQVAHIEWLMPPKLILPRMLLGPRISPASDRPLITEPSSRTR